MYDIKCPNCKSDNFDLEEFYSDTHQKYGCFDCELSY